MNGGVGLAQAIEVVRAELSAAMTEGDGERLQFDVGTVDLEFSVQVRREAEGKAGIKVWVVEAGASGGVSKESTHTVKVSLTPIDTKTGGAPRVRDEVAGPPPRG
ncbi:trypco2 family protein [Nonomuraea sp. NPDC050536]|uniref:trypco2 family protein n=1 Tax=Nonomuraea sp. NPDC050536 TaxID=3364366 RepID=UPI0037C771D7